MNKNIKIMALGEILLRLTPPNGTLTKDATSFSATYGGAEANVLISLANMGYQTSYLTRFPKDNLGQAATRYLRSQGVDYSHSAFASEDTLGMYILEKGEGSRPCEIIYNRKHSTAAFMKPEDFDFDQAFEGATHFHLSGITLFICDDSRETALVALKKAKEHGLTVSFDFNYRAKLLSEEKAKEIYPEVAKYCDIIFASPWDIRTLLGFEPEEKDDTKLFLDAQKHFGFDYIFTKKRTIYSAQKQSIIAACYHQGVETVGKEYTFEIFDRIGAGDAFAAGCIGALCLDHDDPKQAIDFGVANSVLKQTISGDSAHFSIDTLKAYLSNNGCEEVRR